MSRVNVVLIALAILAVTALTACGSSDSGGSSAADKPAATSPSTTAAAAASAPTAAAPASAAAPANTASTATVALCRQTFAPFIAELRHLNHDVTQTITYKSYSAATNKLIKDYLKTDPIPKGPGCQNKVLPPTVQAYFTHLTATYDWKLCRQRHDCAKQMAQLKAKWRKSKRLTADATKALDNLTTA